MLDKVKTFLSLFSNGVNLIGIILLASFFLLRNPSSKWDKTISGDGKSYYAYLTTSFIYHDLDYKYIESYEAKYYPPDQSLFKEFRQVFNGETVNKTFPGIALLWLPFFLIAHFLSYLFGYDPDGYSLLYQYAIGVSAVFYVWLGLKWLQALLKSLGFKPKVILPTLIGLVFATNLFFYTIHDPSLTHAYNFALLAGILYYARRFFLERKTTWLLIAFSIYTLAIITRPTNIFMVLFLPIAVGNLNDCKQFITLILNRKKHLISIILISITVGLIPIIWWYIQTGHFIVYSYGKEGFDFSNPHWFEIFFSYEKGWFVYSPILFLIVFGLAYYLKQNRLVFFSSILGFALLSYIFSCWWIWTYGASYGQRVFIDYYAIIGVLLASGLTLIQRNKTIVVLWLLLALGFTGLNQLQIYQFKNGILPTTGVTKQSYWDSYFVLKKWVKTEPIASPTISIAEYRSDFETNKDWITNNQTNTTHSFSGKKSQLIFAKNQYSGGYAGLIPNKTQLLLIKASVYCDNNSTDPFLIFDLKKDGKNIHYQAIGLNKYLVKNKWIKFHYAFEVDAFDVNTISTYFWNPTHNRFWIDDLEISFVYKD